MGSLYSKTQQIAGSKILITDIAISTIHDKWIQESISRLISGDFGEEIGRYTDISDEEVIRVSKEVERPKIKSNRNRVLRNRLCLDIEAFPPLIDCVIGFYDYPNEIIDTIVLKWVKESRVLTILTKTEFMTGKGFTPFELDAYRKASLKSQEKYDRDVAEAEAYAKLKADQRLAEAVVEGKPPKDLKGEEIKLSYK